MNINAIQNRTGNFLLIAGDLHRCTNAIFFRITMVTARAGIHRSQKDELGGKLQSTGSARNIDNAVFQGLAQIVQSYAGKFGEFIQKKNAAVSERNFSRSWPSTAAD